MDACPDFIGVVKIFAVLELESRYSGKHFSKVSESNRGCDLGYKSIIFKDLRFRNAICTLVLMIWMLALRL
jgi:hypothetical protein